MRVHTAQNVETFYALAELGAKLVALHLLEDPALMKTGIALRR